MTESSALISGEVVSDNGAPITERGFVWVKGTDIPTISSNRVKVEGTIGDYTVALSGLYPNQSYSYRAYARNSKGVAYGETLIFKTLVALPELELVLLSDITSSSAVVSAKVTAHGGETVSEVGFLYGTTSSLDTSTSSRVTSSYNTDSFLFALDNLSRATEYYIRPYATNSAGTAYGETAQFVTLPDLPSVTTSEVTDITETSAVCGGVITDDGGGEIIAKGVVWSRYENPTVDQITKTDDGGGETLLFTSYMSGMFSGTTYYVRAYVTNEAGTSYGEQKEFATYGAYIEYFYSANSFIVSEAGTYMFGAVKGNSMQSVGSVASVEVLWESFGTDEVPEVGSLISSVSYNNGTITFSTPNTYRKGNAVIAAKDASGITLWSWHIWLTDQPQEHVYNNYAGTMMDRNLGATSATPGDVGALGLLYQWGRKDPFLGTSSISSRTIAKSTISWPSPVSSDSSKGTIDYAISNPTTFIGSDENDEIDWYYTDSGITDDTRWQSEKTIYDPCPSGWRVPDGGDYGVWEAAGFSNTTFDSTNRGFSFSISNPSATWYPAAGYRYSSGGHCGAGYSGNYWSVTPIGEPAFELHFSGAGSVSTSSIVAPRARGLSVRCFKEDIDCGSNNDNDFSTSDAKSLSDSGTANSYIVSKSGVYSIPAVKGNSSESVGSVASAEVLWESFGTDVQPSKGDLVETVIYQNGKVYFKTPTAYREGNAVIAAKDASGKILWSWHIWLTDQPQEQEYYNNAGIMMDRNLGATSATPGDVGALGLLYQWGRKDPFLGSSSISSSTLAKSTITWPSNVSSNISNGTIEYATANPTTFITYNSSNIDWYYTGSDSTDNTRWQSDKTIYDPCPAGWRVPDGSGSGVWSKALGSSSSYTGTYDSTNKGMNFSGKFGEASTIWYPDSGYRYYDDGALYKVGYYGYFWSVTPYSGGNAYRLYFDYDGYVDPSSSSNRAYGFGVRCVQE